MTCAETTIALGAYVLGALDPGERAEVDAHLRGCAACRGELAELATLPPLLERLSLQDLGESVPTVVVPDALFEKVVASVRDDERRVTWLRRRPARALLAAAAAVIVLGGGIATAVTVGGSSGSSSDVHSQAQGSVRMQVTVASQTTGTALHVEVSGLPVDEHCRLIAVADDGTREQVGRWDATYAGNAQVTGSTSIPSSHLARLVLLGNGGTELVTVPI
jgi:predicted anti-sigma-YlaC factor YlaD